MGKRLSTCPKYRNICPCTPTAGTTPCRRICHYKDHSTWIVLERTHLSNKKRGTWQRGQGKDHRQIYMRCPSCAQINRVPEWNVKKGFVGEINRAVRHCTTCMGCRLHFYAYLENWGKRIRTSGEALSPGPGRSR